MIHAIDPQKDVDGFHPVNAGHLMTGARGLVPCTPLGALMLVKSVREDIAGLDAVVVGRSNIVGKPMAQLLINESCTVTVAHSKSRDLPGLCRRADILVAAVGRPEMIRGDWVKPGAIVIDVGINRVPNPAAGEGKTRLVGDVAFAEAREVAGAITPVPGGVGPMTIACLMRNTVRRPAAGAGSPCRSCEVQPMKTNPGRFFEDFRLGETLRHATPRTVTTGDAALYAALYGTRFAVQSSDAFAKAAATREAPSTTGSSSTSCSARPCPTSRSTPSPISAMRTGAFSSRSIRARRCPPSPR